MSLQGKRTQLSFKEEGVNISLNGGSFEDVSMKGLNLSLIASGDGTEIIVHRLLKGQTWGLTPQEGWTALESIYIISGELCYKGKEDVVLRKGNSLSASPVKKHSVFVALTDVEFLYISSQPVFHYYSNNNRELLELAVRVEQKDGYTADHCDRIKKLATKVGEKMGISSHKMFLLNFGSFHHDLGKTRVPDYILGKPSKLTNEEFEIIKTHTTLGRQILEESGLPYLIEAAPIVEQHHERYDGKGYPHGLKGDEIRIEAAIVAVVDSYDAMTTNRVYSKGRSKEDAIREIIRCKGTMYHPDVVDAFISIINEID